MLFLKAMLFIGRKFSGSESSDGEIFAGAFGTNVSISQFLTYFCISPANSCAISFPALMVGFIGSGISSSMKDSVIKIGD